MKLAEVIYPVLIINTPSLRNGLTEKIINLPQKVPCVREEFAR
jgi:hypothetical protein